MSWKEGNPYVQWREDRALAFFLDIVCADADFIDVDDLAQAGTTAVSGSHYRISQRSSRNMCWRSDDQDETERLLRPLRAAAPKHGIPAGHLQALARIFELLKAEARDARVRQPTQYSYVLY